MNSTMLELLDTAVVHLDGQGCIEHMNGAAELCLGTGRDRVRGLPFKDLAGVSETIKSAVSASLDDQRRRHLRECHMAGGLYDCSIQALDDRSVVLELSDQKWEQQTQQLAQREIQTGMLDLLRRNLGHEIRNPLGGIRGAAQMLAAELGDRELGTLARLIMREVDRIDELIERFGQQKFSHQEADIHMIADEAIELVLAESAGSVLVHRDYDPSIPNLHADSSGLRQVLLNLVLNAYQSGAQEVRMRTRIEYGSTLLQAGQNSVLRVDVEDDGAGVPEQLRAMLFLPLVTGRRDGTGLGLALSQQIAAAHGGLLTYEPLEPGSRFSLRMPLRSARVEQDRD